MCNIFYLILLITIILLIHKNDKYEFFDSQPHLVYGDNPIILSNSPIPYIRNTNDIIEIPNSMSALRHLTDVDIYSCVQDKDILVNEMQLQKNKTESFIKRPSSLIQNMINIHKS